MSAIKFVAYWILSQATCVALQASDLLQECKLPVCCVSDSLTVSAGYRLSLPAPLDAAFKACARYEAA